MIRFKLLVIAVAALALSGCGKVNPGVVKTALPAGRLAPMPKGNFVAPQAIVIPKPHVERGGAMGARFMNAAGKAGDVADIAQVVNEMVSRRYGLPQKKDDEANGKRP